MGTQLYLPVGWARHPESRIDPVEWLAELEDDSLLTKADIGEILCDELSRVLLHAHICERAGFVYCFLRGGGT